MKRINIVILLSGLLVGFGFTIISVKKEKIDFREFNLVTLVENQIYIDQTEISNGNYKAYLEWLIKSKDSNTYFLMYPDTQVWKHQLGTFNEPFVLHYFQHPAYSNFPVVGVTFQQANAYCYWRADRIMETMKFKKMGISKVTMRLPTEKEWKLAARGSLPDTAIYPWEGNEIRFTVGKKKNLGKVRLNVRIPLEEHMQVSEKAEFSYITTPVYSYWPNTIGAYNICGNVSEWVAEHKAKGGSWHTFAKEAQINFEQSVLADTARFADVGFRCVLEIAK